MKTRRENPSETKANINAAKHDSKTRDILDKSMQILMKCYADDQRKTYHAVTFAEQALEYISFFGDSSAKQYIESALKWLKELQVERKYNNKVRILILELNKLL
ncbi:MAG: hypothetical protein H7Z76_07300 [Methylotenera sp.]|nr:hypothetical protein [Flavobacterium sp.]